MYGLNQINQASFSKMKECDAQAGASLGCSPMPAPTEALEHSLQSIHTRIDSLTAALHHLGGKLAVVTYPAPPEATGKAGQPVNSSAPLLAILDAERDRLQSLLGLVDSMVSRLIF